MYMHVHACVCTHVCVCVHVVYRGSARALGRHSLGAATRHKATDHTDGKGESIGAEGE